MVLYEYTRIHLTFSIIPGTFYTYQITVKSKKYIFHRYPNAQHAFNDPYNPLRFDPISAEDSWPKLIEFFNKAMKN